MFGDQNNQGNGISSSSSNNFPTNQQSQSNSVSINGYTSPYTASSRESTPVQTSASTLNTSIANQPQQSLQNALGSSPINAEINASLEPLIAPNSITTNDPLPTAPEQEENTLSVQSIISSGANQQSFQPNPSYEVSQASLANMDYSIKELLDIVIKENASDLHLTVGYPATIRIDGKLNRIGAVLTYEKIKKLIYETLKDNQRELLEVNKEVDLSYQHAEKARFRVNAYYERGNLAAAYRLIPTRIRTIEELKLPPVLYDFTRLPQGLFLVTGPTGSGKSTTLAAMLQEINEHHPKHIITVEDPIEYVYSKSKALVDQRELGQDTHDWSIALKSILRQDPDIVLIGEMRDFETIQAVLTIAETGHLVFATLHTNSAAQSIDRIIDVFPPHQQEQVRMQLAGSLKAILSQRLIPKTGGGREAAAELMIVNSAIQNLIREGKTYQIDNVISTSYDVGMISLERSLVKMIREGKITVETAQQFAIRPEEVLKLMKSGI